jgi:hypothetical protein
MRKHLAVFAAAAISTQAAWATNYTITTYDFPGAVGTTIFGMNAVGRIAGQYIISGTTPAGLFGAMGFTERNGVYTSVGDTLPCRWTGRCRTVVWSVNAFGQMAGTFSGDVDFPGAFTQTLNGAPVIVQPPGYPNTAIQALAGPNNFGEIAGCFSSFDYSDQQQIIFTQIGGQFTVVQLPLANVNFACAFGVNNLGQLTGLVSTGTDYSSHGFILTGNQLQLLEPPADWGYDGQSLRPVAINDFGAAIGTYVDTSGQVHGFVAHGAQMTKVDFPGALNTDPTHINDRGEILGTYEIPTADGTGVQTLTFLLHAGVYSTVTLPLAGAVNIAGMDNFGRLFGSYDTHGFVATPVAE